jgi:Ca-activated chloride channel family protein
VEFTWPVMLWGLLLLPAFVGWYLVGVRRVRARAVRRFAEDRLFATLAVRLPTLWRHVSMGLYFAALGLLLVAAGRPVMALPTPVNRAVVMLVIDTSGSMAAPDVPPSRLDAARAAARAFLDAAPRGLKVGLVSFSTYATLMVPPTPDHNAVRQALLGLKPQEATAIGDGIAVALRAIPGRVVSVPGQPPSPFAPNPPPSGPGSPGASPPRPEDLPPAALILLSDGGQNAGTADPLRMALVARDQKVKIYTVGLGTPGGGVFSYQGQLVLVPFDPTLLQQLAAITGGKFFFSATAKDLAQVYRDLGRTLGWELRKTEVSSLFVGGAGVLMLGGGVLSLLWMGRLP